MKYIPLTKGQFAIIDDEDFDIINERKWICWESKGLKYAEAGMFVNKKYKRIRMHRIIMNAKDGEIVDHIDGNGLNNQKSNLRICNQSDNIKNRKPRGGSKYMGVSWHLNRYWLARINVNGKQKYIGIFKNEIDAAKAYDAEVEKTENNFYRKNFN